MTIPPKRLAAQLRAIRHMGGMLYHPQAWEVWKDADDDAFGNVHDALHALRRITPISLDEYLDLVWVGADDLDLRYCAEKGRKIFYLKKSNAHGL